MKIGDEDKRLAGFFWSTFTSVEGKKVLDELHQRFASGTPFNAESDRVTAFWCGQQDVIRFIDDMIKGQRLPEENGEHHNYLEGEEDA